MANLDALDLNTRPMQAGPYGNAVIHEGTATTIAGTANGDIARIVRIPAGTRIQEVTLQNDQVDSNGAPTITAKVGFTPVNATDGPAANDAYWFASAVALRTKAATLYAAQPITFAFDVYIIVTITAAIATLVVGANLTIVAKGSTVGLG